MNRTSLDPSPPHPDPWAPAATATPAEVVADHEQNPEYEIHVGRRVGVGADVEADGPARRYVSLWLRGERFCGWLVAGEPDLAPPTGSR